MCEEKIAIIIPFFKSNFLDELLASLAAQTDQNFHIFLGDDASPTPPGEILEKYKSQLNISYFRFHRNLGGTDLAAQWNRCAQLAEDSEWIWFIPDDDLPSNDCVSEIKEASVVANEIGASIIHLPCVTIDAEGICLNNRTEWPSIIDSAEFYLRQLRGHAPSISLANTIYRREAFDSVGGFKSLPKAWGSDHATTLAVADGGPVVTVPNALLKFRMSDYNISSFSHDAEEKLQARIAFARWLAIKTPAWYGDEYATEIQRWFYLKGEYYVLNVWPFSNAMASRLFLLADACGVQLSFFQKARVILRGYQTFFGKKKAQFFPKNSGRTQI